MSDENAGPWQKYAQAGGDEDEKGPWSKYGGGGVDIASEKEMAKHPPVAQPLEMKPSYSAMAVGNAPSGADPHNPANPNLNAIPEEEREGVQNRLIPLSVAEATFSPTVGEAVATGSLRPFARLGSNLIRGYLGAKGGGYVGHDVGGWFGEPELGKKIGEWGGGLAAGLFGAKIPNPKKWLLQQVLSEATPAAEATAPAAAEATGETTVMTQPRLKPVTDADYTVDKLPKGTTPPTAYEPPVSQGTKPVQRLQTVRPEETQPIASLGSAEEPRRLRVTSRPTVATEEAPNRLRIPISVENPEAAQPFTLEEKGGARWAISRDNPNIRVSVKATDSPEQIATSLKNQADMQKQFFSDRAAEQSPPARLQPVTPEVEMPERITHPVTGVQKQISPDELDAGANSLYGVENYKDLSPTQQQAVTKSLTPTTTGQPIARLGSVSPQGHAFEPPPNRLQVVGPGRAPVNQLAEEAPLARSTEENPANVRFAGQPEQLQAAANRQHEYINGGRFHEGLGGDTELQNEAKKLTNNVETEEGRGSIQRAYQALTGKKAFISGASKINAPGKMGRIAAINEMLDAGYTPKQILQAARTPIEP